MNVKEKEKPRSYNNITTEERTDTHPSYWLWLQSQIHATQHCTAAAEHIMDKMPVTLIRERTSCRVEVLITEPLQQPFNRCSTHLICLIPLRYQSGWWKWSSSTGPKSIINKTLWMPFVYRGGNENKWPTQQTAHRGAGFLFGCI